MNNIMEFDKPVLLDEYCSKYGNGKFYEETAYPRT